LLFVGTALTLFLPSGCCRKFPLSSTRHAVDPHPSLPKAPSAAVRAVNFASSPPPIHGRNSPEKKKRDVRARDSAPGYRADNGCGWPRYPSLRSPLVGPPQNPPPPPLLMLPPPREHLHRPPHHPHPHVASFTAERTMYPAPPPCLAGIPSRTGRLHHRQARPGPAGATGNSVASNPLLEVLGASGRVAGGGERGREAAAAGKF
jgi:hypothetical protein